MIISSEKEMEKLGLSFATKVVNGGVVCLYGELGSGKTTFAKALAKGLGFTGRVISPTFLIMRTYELKKNKLGKFYHLDFYRTEDEKALKNLGIEELFANTHNIVVIEWAEKAKNLLPKKRFDLHFTYCNQTQRNIEIKKVGK
jgi:tRNA threonylcarbamoyladenosine biosynthesis protein TsaE